VIDHAPLGEGRDGEERDARPVAEEVQDLDVAAVVVAAASSVVARIAVSAQISDAPALGDQRLEEGS